MQSPVWGQRLGYETPKPLRFKREPYRQKQLNEARARSALLQEAHRRIDSGEVKPPVRTGGYNPTYQTITKSTTKAMTKTTSQTVTSMAGNPMLQVASGTRFDSNCSNSASAKGPKTTWGWSLWT